MSDVLADLVANFILGRDSVERRQRRSAVPVSVDDNSSEMLRNQAGQPLQRVGRFWMRVRAMCIIAFLGTGLAGWWGCRDAALEATWASLTQQIMVFGRAQDQLAAGEGGAGDGLDYGALVGGDEAAEGTRGQAQLQQGVDVAALKDEEEDLFGKSRELEPGCPAGAGPADGSGPTHLA